MFDSNRKNGGNSGGTGRRAFLVGSGAALAGLVCWTRLRTGPALVEAAPAGPIGQVTIVDFTDLGMRKEILTVAKIEKSDADWKKQLPPDSYEVTRHAGTERPFTGALLNVHDKGIFRCICCDTALFDSSTKFESGTGWPSFWQPIAKENVVETRDSSFGMVRTAVSCRRCDAHLGHLFDDGPRPTGLRYCMNSVSMKFSKA